MSSRRNKVKTINEDNPGKGPRSCKSNCTVHTPVLRDLANMNLNQPEKCNLEILQILIV